jgi:subtilase family serine protease
VLVGTAVAIILAGCGSGSGPAGPEGAAPPADWVAHPPFEVKHLGVAAVSGYAPKQIRHAYGFDRVTANGAGQTIAIVDPYGSPTIQHDLNVFCAQFGLVTTTVHLVYPQGNSGVVDGEWAQETSLDVEWAHVIAPRAILLLVVAKTASFSSLLSAVDYGASHAAQVSMSWGGPEFSGETAYDSHFNRSGVSFVAATGDGGGTPWWPAVSPQVTGVGGTTLYLDGSGNVISEHAWSGGNGGRSVYEPEPAFQKLWQSSGKREAPDVSYEANPNTGVPVYDSTPYQHATGWSELGGTSAGTPQWAGLYARANSTRSTPLTSTNTSLYDLGSPLNFTTYLRDITQGCNHNVCAQPGYDLVTGIGVPRANNLIPALAGS